MPEATGAQLVAAAQTLLGQPYDTGPDRLHPDNYGTDCSGLICRAYRIATGDACPAVVSVTQYQLCRDHGTLISRDAAEHIAGALLFVPDNPEEGWGPDGHVGFSNGDGTTTESTPFAAGGVQVLPILFQRWSPIAGLLPGITYSVVAAGSPPVEAPAPPKIQPRRRPMYLYQTEKRIVAVGALVLTLGPNDVASFAAAGVPLIANGTEAELNAEIERTKH